MRSITILTSTHIHDDQVYLWMLSRVSKQAQKMYAGGLSNVIIPEAIDCPSMIMIERVSIFPVSILLFAHFFTLFNLPPFSHSSRALSYKLQNEVLMAHSRRGGHSKCYVPIRR